MTLATLPYELLDKILANLDMRSAFKLSLVDRSVHARVTNHKTYHLLTTTETALSTLTLLSRTRLLSLHTLSTLTTALCTTTCTCCTIRQTPYIYLSTFARACFTCLHKCPIFQLIPVSLACSLFGTTAASVRHMTLQTIAGVYEIGDGKVQHLPSMEMVSVARVRSLAFEQAGPAAVDSYMASRNADIQMFHVPSVRVEVFIAPYSNMTFECADVQMQLGERFGVWPDLDGTAQEGRHGERKWRASAEMGRAPWPWFDAENGRLMLDQEELVE